MATTHGDGTFVARLCASLVLAALASLGVAGQEPADDGDTLELSSAVVLVPMAVRATSGRAVTGLTGADFLVSDNGAPQEIAFFQRDTAPIDAVLLVDTSASTGASLGLLEQAATAFAKNLRNEDQFALYTFAEKPVSLLAWTNNAK